MALTKKQTTLYVLLISVAVMVALKFVLAPASHVLEGPQTKSKGNPDADIQIVEYIDFQCPACAAGSKYLSGLIEAQPDKYYLTMKYFPLNGHTHALLAAQFAECALQQGKFWPFHDLVLERQSQWARMVSSRPAFELMAQEIELSTPALNKCLADPETEQAVLEDKNEGRALQIRRTPTYFINDKMVVGIKSLQEELNQEVVR